MIGDSAIDVAVARAAGVRAAGVTWGFDPVALRAAGPDRLIDRPLDLASLLAGLRAGGPVACATLSASLLLEAHGPPPHLG